MSEQKEFKPGDFTISLQGKDYLPVAARVKWFRTVHPSGSIETHEIIVDLDRPFSKGGGKVYGYARFHATVKDADGRILGQGTKTETAANFFDYVEKAETGSIGRALAAAGFGTEIDQDLDEGRVVDSPREKPRRGQSAPRVVSQRPSEGGTPPSPAKVIRPGSPATGPIHLQPDVIEWLDQQSKRAGFENLEAACKELDYPMESVLTIEAMQRSLDKELKSRITATTASA